MCACSSSELQPLPGCALCNVLQGSGANGRKTLSFPKGWQGCCLTHPSSCLFRSAKKGSPRVNLFIPSSPCQPDQPASHQGYLHTRREGMGRQMPRPYMASCCSQVHASPGSPDVHLPLWGPYRPSGWVSRRCHRSSGYNEVAGGAASR